MLRSLTCARVRRPATGDRHTLRLRTSLFVLLVACSTAVSAQHVHPDPAPVEPPAQAETDAHAHHGAPTTALPSFIPAVTDADRESAFPDLGGHGPHGTSIHTLVLVDRLEWTPSTAASGFAVDVDGWVGGDINRLWFRSHAAADDSRRAGRAEVFYGRAVARWWDVVAGVAQDVGGGPARTWAGVGVQGLAPFWFDVRAMAYVGAAGRVHVQLDADYDLLITNRLVLQPSASVDLRAGGDPDRRTGAGWHRVEAGARLRYELRRELAPYVGVAWQRALGSTAAIERDAGGAVSDTRVVVGVRVWF